MSKRQMRGWARRQMQMREPVSPWPVWARVLLILGGLGLCGLIYLQTVGG